MCKNFSSSGCIKVIAMFLHLFSADFRSEETSREVQVDRRCSKVILKFCYESHSVIPRALKYLCKIKIKILQEDDSR